ncbi:MAG TPA: signal recognition particle-docking protein FtsY [Gaiellaceae bacterium]|jgi:fused signal recognition particle receptor
MARSWAEFLGDAEGPYETEVSRKGFAARLRDSLSRSRRALTEQLAVVAFDPDDAASWERLEEALLGADVGVRATAELVGRLEARQDLSDLNEALAEEIAALFGPAPTLGIASRPSVILVVGVNGTGKTTTIGKLAQKLREHGRSVTVGAADTFRAAAEEQLELWAQRAGAQFVGGARGSDPASVAYDAVSAGGDVVIVDTAGRLHTQTNLMDELAKVRRVISGRLEGAPHETLLVLDATTGQNGIQQAKLFSEAVGVTGVAITKLDGSGKGGVAVAIAYELGLPVKLIGVGEGIDDLRPFDPLDFARALVAD